MRRYSKVKSFEKCEVIAIKFTARTLSERKWRPDSSAWSFRGHVSLKTLTRVAPLRALILGRIFYPATNSEILGKPATKLADLLNV